MLRRLFRSKPADQPSSFQEHADSITEFLGKAISHEYSQVVSHGLRVSGSFLNALRANQGTIDDQFNGVVQPFHNSITDKLNKVDID